MLQEWEVVSTYWKPSSSSHPHHTRYFPEIWHPTCLSYSFSVCEILKPFPWMMRGLMWGSPSAKIVNWTVHYLLSRPDCAPQCQTVFVPVWLYPCNGRGVWSTFEIVDKWNLPSGPSVVSDAATCWISRWTLQIFSMIFSMIYRLLLSNVRSSAIPGLVSHFEPVKPSWWKLEFSTWI